MDAPLNKAQEAASFLVSWARTVLKCLLVSWYTHLIKETIHFATEFFETGLQTPHSVEITHGFQFSFRLFIIMLQRLEICYFVHIGHWIYILNELNLKGKRLIQIRCVLLRNCKLGKSLMPCLSYLKFPSFTDNACNSLTLDAVANAIKNTVFQLVYYIPKRSL
jgi:hypothetical protein